MIEIDLAPDQEQRPRRLAQARNEDLVQTVRRAIEDFLDVQGWRDVSDQEWAEASVSLMSEVLPEETWREWAEDAENDEPR